MSVKYIGSGNEFYVGAPARDLSDADIAERGLDEGDLIASGLYERVDRAAYGGKRGKDAPTVAPLVAEEQPEVSE